MTGLPKGPCWIAILAAVLLAVVAPSAAAQPRADTSVYEGLGSWVDIFAGPVWTHPDATVSSLAAHGAGTLYLQTSNYSQPAALMRPAALARFVTAAPAAGLAVGA